MKRFILMLVIYLFPNINSQTLPESTYVVQLSITPSPIISLFKTPRYPGAQNNIDVGFGGSVRIMWLPGRLLSIGLMTGIYNICDDEIILQNDNQKKITAYATLRAIPVQGVVSMQKDNFEIGVAMGPYLMLSTINYGTPAKGSRYELGITLFGSYLYALNEFVYLGPELRILYFSYRGILSIMPSAVLHLNLFNY